MNIVVNPGSEPCSNAIEPNAYNNMKHFLLDCDIGAEFTRYADGDDDDGRYTFIVWRGNKCAEVQMPGLPLNNVRWMDQSQNIWDFPRLYIDGSSWIWKVAIDIMKGIFSDDE